MFLYNCLQASDIGKAPRVQFRLLKDGELPSFQTCATQPGTAVPILTSKQVEQKLAELNKSIFDDVVGMFREKGDYTDGILFLQETFEENFATEHMYFAQSCAPPGDYDENTAASSCLVTGPDICVGSTWEVRIVKDPDDKEGTV
jgi:hypothetical protein